MNRYKYEPSHQDRPTKSDVLVINILKDLTPGRQIQMNINTYSFFTDLLQKSKVEFKQEIITDRVSLNSGLYQIINGCHLIVGHRPPLKCSTYGRSIYIVDAEDNVISEVSLYE